MYCYLYLTHSISGPQPQSHGLALVHRSFSTGPYIKIYVFINKFIKYHSLLLVKAGFKKKKENVLQPHCRWQPWSFTISQARLKPLFA